MRQQPSKHAIELRVEWLNKALGRPTVAWENITGNGKPYGLGWKPTDAFYVDHCLGGYRLESNGNPVFGHQRMTKSQLVDQLEAILVAIKLAKNEDHGGAWPKPLSELQQTVTS